jgi:glucose/arabinose dehydrogenase
MFIIEQKGRVLLKDHKGLDHNDLLTVPFLDIIDRVGSQGSEQGLLGLAFHPQYHENGYLFVNYTDHKGDTIVSRFSRSADDPNRADPESEVGLLRIPQPYGNHNGGMLAFGVDGYLYIGLGDGGSAGDPAGNGQSLASLLGKLLRIDVDGGEPYSIPADNPFAGGGGRPEIWLYGLRNPWRFAFDRLTGDLYIGDVGQNQWEEVNYLQAGGPGGANLGWNYFEGNHPYSGAPPAELNFVSPVLEYGREQGCSITGGVVYRGAELPEWQGVYLYGDYCTGRVWGLIQDAQTGWDNALLFDGLGRISSFGEDEAGEIYLVDHGGRVLRLTKK